MYKYFAKRVLISMLVFLGVTFLVYLLSTLMPGSPVTLMVTPEMTPDQVAQLEHNMGVDQPVVARYATWITNFFSGNLGTSYIYKRAVNDLISQRILPTVSLALISLTLAVLVAIPLGVLAAYKPYSAFDYTFSGVSFLGVAMPEFFTALVLIYIFSIRLNILPSSGMHAANDSSFSSIVLYAIMPTVVVTFSRLGSLIRQTRSAMLEVLNEDFVRTDRAMGYGEGAVLLHALRNALIPIVTIIGNSLPAVISGSVIVETVFARPGIGMLMVSAINNRDYPVIVAITTLIAIVVLVCNIVVDFVYTLLDPRIRHESAKG